MQPWQRKQPWQLQQLRQLLCHRLKHLPLGPLQELQLHHAPHLTQPEKLLEELATERLEYQQQQPLLWLQLHLRRLLRWERALHLLPWAEPHLPREPRGQPLQP